MVPEIWIFHNRICCCCVVQKVLMNLIETNISKIKELCGSHKVKTLYVFGSILTSRFNGSSDVDLLVNFDEKDIPVLEFGDNFFDLQFAFEDLFKRRVDLICEDAIKNSIFRKEVDATKKLIYGY